MLDHVTVEGLPLDRFSVIYQIQGDEPTAHARAVAVTIEQTIEFPADLAPAGDIPDHIVGRIESFEKIEADLYRVEISYATEITGLELTQLLNVIFGNSSMKPGVRVLRILPNTRLLEAFRGPRFGIQGLRECLNVFERPILCTALKPMGLSAEMLAEIAYQCALGGIDIIKDDHGLADQSFSTFKDRVRLCAEAVNRANKETGYRSFYMPNVTGPVDRMVSNARFAKNAGAGGLLVSPGLSGYDMLRLLSDDDEIALPIMSHPAFMGSYVTDPYQGIGHYAMYGQITRLAGGDIVVYPNYGGRFSFSKADCREIVEGSLVPMGGIKPIFPAPGGGMTVDRIPEMAEFHGQDVVYLIGGNLHRHGDLAESSRSFRTLVEQQ